MFSKNLADLVDPRIRKKRIDYPLDEIVFTSLVAVISGAESYQDFATFGEEQLKWLKNYFPFANGIPSHDTFRRIFELLDPNSLEKTYRHFIENLEIRTTNETAVCRRQDTSGVAAYSAAVCNLPSRLGKLLHEMTKVKMLASIILSLW